MDFLNVGSSVLGGLLGGAFRLFPEVLKFFDAKNERSHELAMQDKQIEFLKIQGSQKVEEAKIYQEAVDIGALRDVLVEQAKPTGNKFIDGQLITKEKAYQARGNQISNFGFPYHKKFKPSSTQTISIP